MTIRLVYNLSACGVNSWRELEYELILNIEWLKLVIQYTTMVPLQAFVNTRCTLICSTTWEVKLLACWHASLIKLIYCLSCGIQQPDDELLHSSCALIESHDNGLSQ